MLKLTPTQIMNLINLVMNYRKYLETYDVPPKSRLEDLDELFKVLSRALVEKDPKEGK